MKTLGILGGMGSMATIDFFRKIIENTEVQSDQDHLHIIIENYASIPDRTDYILNKKNSPLPKMIEGLKRLETAQVDFLTIPCNTAHYFYDQLQKEVNIPIIHIVKETLRSLKKGKSYLLLATEGTYTANLYRQLAEGVNILYPNAYMQLSIDDLIYTYKKDNIILEKLKHELLELINELDIEGVILGCTELPIIFSTEDFIDPTLILARRVIELSGAKLKEAI